MLASREANCSRVRMPPKKHKSGHQKRVEKEARSRNSRAGAQDIKTFFFKNGESKLPRAAETISLLVHSFNVCNMTGHGLEPTLAVIRPRSGQVASSLKKNRQVIVERRFLE